MSQIKKFREKAGLTQRALAAQVGVAEITVRKWEREKRAPRIESIRALAKVFGCEPAKLL
jgi:transcriptional regulator with XRE-family HTH domain